MKEQARALEASDQEAKKPQEVARFALAELRKDARLSYSELGRRLNTTPTQIRKMETGDLGISLEWMHKLAHALDVKMSAFLAPDEVEAPLDQPTREIVEITSELSSMERQLAVRAVKDIVLLARRLSDSSDGPRLRGDSTLAEKLASSWESWSPNQRRRAVALLETAAEMAAE